MKTTIEHVRDGTYERSRHAGRGDVELAIDSPSCPECLSGAARELWDLIVSTLPDEVQSAIDSPTLTGMCIWWGKFCELEDASDINDYRQMTMQAMAWKNFSLMAAKFGMSPMDRCRIKLPKGESSSNALERLLSKRGGKN